MRYSFWQLTKSFMIFINNYIQLNMNDKLFQQFQNLLNAIFLPIYQIKVYKEACISGPVFWLLRVKGLNAITNTKAYVTGLGKSAMWAQKHHQFFVFVLS